MSLASKLRHELVAMSLAMVYFGAWIGALLLVKQLVLAEYDIAFRHYSLALVGALILSKVVLILEHVPLGAWVRAQPPWVDLLLRTALYAAGVLLVLLLEHGLRERHAAGGFVAAVRDGLLHAKAPHVLANTICLSGALFIYNVLTVIRHQLGPGGLLQLFSRARPGS